MKLSIIIINCRQADQIKEMLTHVEVPNDEVEFIIVDDASNDKNLSVLGSYLDHAFRNSRIVYLSNKGFCGGARNAGLREATGDWVWFVDGDDEIAPNAIARVLDTIDSAKDVNCIVLDYKIIGPESCDEVSFCNVRPADRLQLWNVGIMAWFKVIRREVVHEFRFDLAEDNDWWVCQCIRIISRQKGRADYATVPGGACYFYNKLLPGSFTTALLPFGNAKSREAAVQSLFDYPETAEAVAAVTRMLAEMVNLAADLKRSNMPAEFILHHSFALRWWLERISKIGSEI